MSIKPFSWKTLVQSVQFEIILLKVTILYFFSLDEAGIKIAQVLTEIIVSYFFLSSNFYRIFFRDPSIGKQIVIYINIPEDISNFIIDCENLRTCFPQTLVSLKT